MCLILLAWQHHPDYPLVVAANRDEFFDRPARAAAFWDEAPDLLAGRDLQAGGTWLGVTRRGRFAALTNFRDPPSHREGAPSRGELVTGFLLGDEVPEAYIESLLPRAGDYNGFNLLVADRGALFGFGNRAGGVRRLAPGVHGISNGALDEPWPKVREGRAALSRALAAPNAPDPEAILELLADDAPAPAAELPDTGVGAEWEQLLSPRFIRAPGYGTRCSTVLLLGRDQRAVLFERTYTAEGLASGTVRHRFELQLGL